MQIEIWSDVICPWCYIGKRRFEMALADFPHKEEVRVIWRSFELDPDSPRRLPGTLEEMLANVRCFEAIQRSIKSGAIETV